MLVRWLFFSVSARLDLVSVNTRSSPAYKKMHPSATRRAREQAASCSKYVNQQAASKVGSSRSVPMVLLSLDFGQEMHSTYLDKARVRAVGPSCSQRATIREFRDTVGENLQNDTKSKGKGKRPTQGRIAKRITPLQRRLAKRPPDHQARRRSRKETFFPKWRKTEDCPARRQ